MHALKSVCLGSFGIFGVGMLLLGGCAADAMGAEADVKSGAGDKALKVYPAGDLYTELPGGDGDPGFFTSESFESGLYAAHAWNVLAEPLFELEIAATFEPTVLLRGQTVTEGSWETETREVVMSLEKTGSSFWVDDQFFVVDSPAKGDVELYVYRAYGRFARFFNGAAGEVDPTLIVTAKSSLDGKAMPKDARYMIRLKQVVSPAAQHALKFACEGPCEATPLPKGVTFSYLPADGSIEAQSIRATVSLEDDAMRLIGLRARYEANRYPAAVVAVSGGEDLKLDGHFEDGIDGRFLDVIAPSNDVTAIALAFDQHSYIDDTTTLVDFEVIALSADFLAQFDTLLRSSDGQEVNAALPIPGAR